MHMGKTESPSNQTAVSKRIPDLFGQRIGDHVKVFGFSAEQQIPDTPTNKMRIEAGFFEATQHRQRIIRDITARYDVIRSWNDGWFNC